MKKFLALCSIGLAALAVSAQEQTPNTSRSSAPGNVTWVRLNSEEGRFSVLLPELVKDQAESRESPIGPYTTHLFVAKTAKGLFIIGWVDYDESFNFSVPSELEANRDKFVNGMKATLLTTIRITLNGNPGLEFTAETTDAIFKSRVYVVGRRPYQLIAGTYKGQEDSSNVARFFDSFQVRRR